MKKISGDIKKFKLIAAGGTFDHLHKGHKSLLRFSFTLGEKIIIGVTGDLYIQKNKLNNSIESYKERVESLKNFLINEGLEKRAIFVEINDIFGPLLKREFPIEALVVSENLIKVGEVINKKRIEDGLPNIFISTYPMVYGEDQKLISSSRIRKGEINRDGRSYIKPLWFFHRVMLPENLRYCLKKPVGRLFKKDALSIGKIDLSYLITVGDEATRTFTKKGFCPKISIIDFFVERKRKYSNLKELGFLGKEKLFFAENPAGYLTPSLFENVVQVFNQIEENKNMIIQVNGEEDLSVLPLLLCAPLGYTIFYGQPKEGIVMVEVTEEMKEWVYDLVNKFVL